MVARLLPPSSLSLLPPQQAFWFQGKTCTQLGAGEVAPHDCLSTRHLRGPMARRRGTHGALSNNACSHLFIRLHISGAGAMAHEISRFRQVTGSTYGCVWMCVCMLECHDDAQQGTAQHRTGMMRGHGISALILRKSVVGMTGGRKSQARGQTPELFPLTAKARPPGRGGQFGV